MIIGCGWRKYLKTFHTYEPCFHTTGCAIRSFEPPAWPARSTRFSDQPMVTQAEVSLQNYDDEYMHILNPPRDLQIVDKMPDRMNQVQLHITEPLRVLLSPLYRIIYFR
jgi:hypothetical protein